uniref:Uncharacterized protein n=1 Tax=Tetradesmus obliquus TaxID=3088 RepID=A0A383WNF3_TETOB|eukprot:jgi/Sobl393_1/13869/SZX78988.1
MSLLLVIQRWLQDGAAHQGATDRRKLMVARKFVESGLVTSLAGAAAATAAELAQLHNATAAAAAAAAATAAAASHQAHSSASVGVADAPALYGFGSLLVTLYHNLVLDWPGKLLAGSTLAACFQPVVRLNWQLLLLTPTATNPETSSSSSASGRRAVFSTGSLVAAAVDVAGHVLGQLDNVEVPLRDDALGLQELQLLAMPELLNLLMVGLAVAADNLQAQQALATGRRRLAQPPQPQHQQLLQLLRVPHALQTDVQLTEWDVRAAEMLLLIMLCVEARHKLLTLQQASSSSSSSSGGGGFRAS